MGRQQCEELELGQPKQLGHGERQREQPQVQAQRRRRQRGRKERKPIIFKYFQFLFLDKLY